MAAPTFKVGAFFCWAKALVRVVFSYRWLKPTVIESAQLPSALANLKQLKVNQVSRFEI